LMNMHSSLVFVVLIITYGVKLAIIIAAFKAIDSVFSVFVSNQRGICRN